VVLNCFVVLKDIISPVWPCLSSKAVAEVMLVAIDVMVVVRVHAWLCSIVIFASMIFAEVVACPLLADLSALLVILLFVTTEKISWHSTNALLLALAVFVLLRHPLSHS